MPQYQGIWTLAQAAQLQSTQRWATDPLFENTTLLLQADNAANGAQNNTFLDSSSNNFTITRNGNTTQGTFSPFSQSPGWWGNYFPGTSGVSAGSSATLAFGTGNFTIECWAFLPSVSANSLIASSRVINGTSNNYWSLYAISTNQIEFQSRSAGGTQYYARSNTNTFLPNTWNHIAVTRSSGLITVYVNGVAGTTTVNDGSVDLAEQYIGIGLFNFTTYESYLVGYVSNFRAVKGGVLYTGNFTPSTAPLTTTVSAGTVSLLTCQSNRFIDNSANAFSLSVGGTPSVQAFSPFAPQYQWTAPVIGGSGYFDGTGDQLVAPSNTALAMGTGDFQIEFWAYHTSIPASFTYIDTRPTGTNGSYITLAYNNTPNGIFLFVNGTLISTGVTPAANSWAHLVLSRVSGTSRIFLNGAQIGSASDGTNYIVGAQGFGIGANTIAAGNNFFGYMAGFRVVKGSGVSSVTVPTTPPTAITNTSLLLNFTNAGIYDGTMKNNLETVGNAQVNTSVVKYGTGSMYFDGANDALTLPNSPVLQLGSADFTCEFWAYRLAAANMTWVFLNGNSSNYAALRLDTDTSGNIFLLMSTSGSAWAINTSGSAVLPLSTWTHIAAVRFGGTMRLYVNGIALISTTISGSLTAGTSQQVGANFGATQVVNGYVDDLRLTNGIARYTANFTPPTVALPRQ